MQNRMSSWEVEQRASPTEKVPKGESLSKCQLQIQWGALAIKTMKIMPTASSTCMFVRDIAPMITRNMNTFRTGMAAQDRFIRLMTMDLM